MSSFCRTTQLASIIRGRFGIFFRTREVRFDMPGKRCPALRRGKNSPWIRDIPWFPSKESDWSWENSVFRYAGKRWSADTSERRVKRVAGMGMTAGMGMVGDSNVVRMLDGEIIGKWEDRGLKVWSALLLYIYSRWRCAYPTFIPFWKVLPYLGIKSRFCGLSPRGLGQSHHLRWYTTCICAMPTRLGPIYILPHHSANQDYVTLANSMAYARVLHCWSSGNWGSDEYTR